MTDEQRDRFDVPVRFRPDHHLSVGKEYIVIGVALITGSAYGHSPLFEIVDDDNHLVMYPGALFEITDARCSSFWRAKVHEDGALTLRPEELYRDYFHDDLSEREPGAVRAFQALLSKMRAEFE